jgi:hypothetical protein
MMPYKCINAATFRNAFLDQIKIKNQKTKKPNPLWQGKKIVSNQTGSQPSMCDFCNCSVKNCSSESLALPTPNSGPCHTVTVTSYTSPSAQKATICHATEGIQRSNLGRPSSQAAHATSLRASALQQHNSPVGISRKAAVPSQGARARAVSRHQSGTKSNDAELANSLKFVTRPFDPPY